MISERNISIAECSKFQLIGRIYNKHQRHKQFFFNKYNIRFLFFIALKVYFITGKELFLRCLYLVCDVLNMFGI